LVTPARSPALPEAPYGRPARILAAATLGCVLLLFLLLMVPMRERLMDALEPWENILMPLTWLCLPATPLIALAWAILARKARSAARLNPDRFRPPGAAGGVMVGAALLVFLAGVVGLPALYGNHRPRFSASRVQMLEVLGTLPAEYEKLQEAGTAEEAIPGKLEAYLRGMGAYERNAFDRSLPAVSDVIRQLRDGGAGAAVADARARAVRRGQVVVSLQLPRRVPGAPAQSGWAAAAVRVKARGEPEEVLAKGVPLG
jgi:hypothetical protein